MATTSRKLALLLGAAGAAAAAVALRGRRRRDPAHAPGHQHLGPPPETAGNQATSNDTRPPHDQPWVRRSHSDSQRRRFRR